MLTAMAGMHASITACGSRTCAAHGKSYGQGAKGSPRQALSLVAMVPTAARFLIT